MLELPQPETILAIGTILLPLIAGLAFASLVPFMLFSKFMMERYERMYLPFMLSLIAMLLVDFSFFAEQSGMILQYKSLEILSFLLVIAGTAIAVRNTASVYVLSEVTKVLEKEVAKKTGELNKRVEELTESRTALINIMDELEESKRGLEVSYEELTTLDNMKEELISNVSHELRTPLTVAKGAIELTMEDESDPEKRELLVRGKASLIRLNDLIEELLTAAKLKAEPRPRDEGVLDLGKLIARPYVVSAKVFSREPVDIGELITKGIEEFATAARIKNITIAHRVQDGLPKVLGDISDLRILFSNLMSNAIKFNKENGKISIDAKATDDTVLVSVSDTGIGIAKEHLDKIFQRFYQVESDATRSYPGVGLGLWIAKNIVEKHGGKIWVESQAGRGSAFILELPGIALQNK